jgi:hypothetical protein
VAAKDTHARRNIIHDRRNVPDRGAQRWGRDMLTASHQNLTPPLLRVCIFAGYSATLAHIRYEAVTAEAIADNTLGAALPMVQESQ